MSSFSNSGFFVLRTPLLPIDAFTDWGFRSAGDENAIASRELLRARLLEWMTSPLIRESIFLGAPDLEEYLPIWKQEPESKKGRRVEKTLVRFFTRLTSRPTPFGLFAGNTIGEFGSESELSLLPGASYQRKTTLDSDYLILLLTEIAKTPALRESISFVHNTSLYSTGESFRYLFREWNENGSSFSLYSIRNTVALRKALKAATNGARISKIASSLRPHFSPPRATRFVNQLISDQILVPDFGFPLTGNNELDDLVSQLRAMSDTRFSDLLQQAARLLNSLDQEAPGIALEKYDSIARLLNQMPVQAAPSSLVHVDLWKPAVKVQLDSTILDALTNGIAVLHRLFGSAPKINPFVSAFEARYGDREVPLAQVLDEEAGIGFPAPSVREPDPSTLLVDIAFPDVIGESVWTGRERVLLQKVGHALTHGTQEIRLSETDFAEMNLPERAPLPDAFYVIASIAANQPTLLRTVCGPSGATLLARFAGSNAVLKEKLQAHLRQEESLRSDAIFAEIVHLPDSRSANFQVRPLLREYEIPYLAASGAPRDKQIPITDITVSLRNGRIILRSQALNREIVPRMSTAHDFSRSSSNVYQFLCALQSQGISAMMQWNWGPLASLPFLPRVISENVVLAKARWLIRKEEVDSLVGNDDLELLQKTRVWRNTRNIPRYVNYVEESANLLIDFENILSLESFLALTRDMEMTVLEEIYPPPSQLAVKSVEGHFVHEVIIPFVCENSSVKDRKAFIPVNEQISFSPFDSEWLYVKLYCEPEVQDIVLRDVIAPWIQKHNRLLRLWFFIRYSDPESHLRIRLRCKKRAPIARMLRDLELLLSSLLAQRAVWKLQLDTYDRESDRYGGDASIEYAEQIFHIDSQIAIRSIERSEPEELSRFAFAVMDRTLSDFGFTLAAKHDFTKKVASAWRQDFLTDREFLVSVDQLFRTHRKSLETSAQNFKRLLDQRTKKIRISVQQFTRLQKKNQLSRSIEEILASLIHMSLNRLLRSDQTRHELVLFELLSRFYESQIARNADMRNVR